VNFRLGLTTVLLVLFAVAGCSEDVTTPSGQPEIDRLAGVWHVISDTWGETTRPWPEGSTYWHFKHDGHYCSETRVGHGYGITACGEVTRSLVLTEVFHTGTVKKFQLVLSEDGASLSSYIIEASGPTADRYDLVRSADRDAIDCECE